MHEESPVYWAWYLKTMIDNAIDYLEDGDPESAGSLLKTARSTFVEGSMETTEES
jgi:hypothetical protein